MSPLFKKGEGERERTNFGDSFNERTHPGLVVVRYRLLRVWDSNNSGCLVSFEMKINWNGKEIVKSLFIDAVFRILASGRKTYILVGHDSLFH